MTGRNNARLLLLALVAAAACYFLTGKRTQTPRLEGVVVGPDGPVADAIVRIPTTSIQVNTDKAGQFQLTPPHGFDPDGNLVSAAHPNFLIGSSAATNAKLTIRLEPLPEHDNRHYAWRDPRPASAHEEACAKCHAEAFEQWSRSGHSRSAVNVRFRDLHEGVDRHGGRSGWSLRDDHPDGAGVCFACHAPAAHADAAFDADFGKLDPVAAQGVHCDFCHKVRDVTITELGLTHGVDAFDLLRPSGSKQLFFGPLDDVTRGDDVYSPLMKQSHYCAACHEGTVFGMPVYTTYSEWLDSRAAKEGKSCQSCHMPSDGSMERVAKGGPRRRPHSISTHNMLPGGKLAMLKKAIEMKVQYDQNLSVSLRTQNVGHRTPTGYIDRHLILVITSEDADAISERVISGPRLEDYAGESFAGAPGKLFARVVRDPDGIAPSPFWRSFDDPIDTRLKPDTTTTLSWRIHDAPATLRVRLLYRRFWESVRREKGWEDETLVIYDRQVSFKPVNSEPANSEPANSEPAGDTRE